MSEPKHGVDGWDLSKYRWDPETQVAKLTYEQTVKGRVVDTREVEHYRPIRPQ